VGRLLERELKDVVGFEGQGGWNGDIKTVRAVLEAGVEHVLGIGKGEGKGEVRRDEERRPYLPICCTPS
jgi:hypothetical protein